MDMPFNTLTLAQSEALRRILGRAASGHDTLVPDAHDGTELLDMAAEQLAVLRRRAIRVSVPLSGLSLSGLMAAITGRSDLAAQDDGVLELGFRMLTVCDEGCDGIVLLVSGADRLQLPALRYIQFACRAGRDLCIVLAGTGLAGMLAAPELAALQARSAANAVATAPAMVKPNTVMPAVAAPVAMPAEVAVVRAAPVPPAHAISAVRVRPIASASVPGAARRGAWAVAGLGVATAVALGMWMAQAPPQTPGGQVAAAAGTVALPALVPAVTGVSVLPQPAPNQAAAPPALAAIPDAADPSETLPVPPLLVAPLAAPPRAAARRQESRTRDAAATQSAARRPAQPRPLPQAASPEAFDEDRNPAPRSWRPDETFGPMYSTLGQPRSFIGTYSTNPDGTRTFRTEP